MRLAHHFVIFKPFNGNSRVPASTLTKTDRKVQPIIDFSKGWRTYYSERITAPEGYMEFIRVCGGGNIDDDGPILKKKVFKKKEDKTKKGN